MISNLVIFQITCNFSEFSYLRGFTFRKHCASVLRLFFSQSPFNNIEYCFLPLKERGPNQEEAKRHGQKLKHLNRPGEWAYPRFFKHGFTKRLLVLIYTRSKPALLPQFTKTKEPVVFIYHRGEVTDFGCVVCVIKFTWTPSLSQPLPQLAVNFLRFPLPPSLAGDKKMSGPLFVYPIMPLCRYKRSKLH